MSISMYQSSVPVMSQMLRNLKSLLHKGRAHAEARHFDEAVLLNGRLAPDMYPLCRRVQVATDMAKGAAGRLAGLEPPFYADDEATFDELLARIDQTLLYLKGFTPEQIDGSEARPVTSKTRHGTLHFDSGQTYLLNYALPNFYFQISTAYLILRHNGVDIGLDDYLGPVAT
jgi:uncharacterized protein